MKSTQAIQAVAKWIVASFASVGAVVVAGLQISTLASTKGLTLQATALALSSFAAAILAIGWVIFSAARVLLPEFDSLSQLADRQDRALVKAAKDNRTLEQIDQLFEGIRLRRRDLFQTSQHDNPKDLMLQSKKVSEAYASSLTAGRARLDNLVLTVDQLRALDRSLGRDEEALLQYGNAWIAERRYRHLLGVLLIAGFVIAAAVASFALAVRDNSPDVVAPIGETLQFRTPSVASKLIGPGCTSAQLQAVAVGGTLLRPIVITRSTAKCPATIVSAGNPSVLALPTTSGQATTTRKGRRRSLHSGHWNRTKHKCCLVLPGNG